MSDLNENPPAGPSAPVPTAEPSAPVPTAGPSDTTGPGPGLRPAPLRAEDRAAIDEALSKATHRTAGEPLTADLPLKRQWDADLEAELEAALEGFDPKNIEVAAPRAPRGERAGAAAPKSERGQEARPGARTGKVLSIRGNTVFIDLGGKSEGVLTVDQFQGMELPAPGSAIEVVVDRFDPSEGVQLLRLKGSAIDADWSNLRRGVVVEARVTKTVKGGAEVDVNGIRGFLPISQIDFLRVEDASGYVNQKFKAIVTEVNARERNLVVSRREWLEQERAEQRERTWATLEEGQTREGVVRSIKDFGAFVDLGGVDGLLPIGEMSWSRIAKVDAMVKIGDKVTVKILKLDPVSRKLTLGLKQLTPSPWESAVLKYPRGTMVAGKVTRTAEFGAFVELEPGLEGLIHISELSPARVRRAADIVSIGQEVEVRVLKVEPEAKRIALSLLPDPRKAAAAAPAEDEADDEDEAPPVPRPERKVPLKGGLGDRERQNRRR